MTRKEGGFIVNLKDYIPQIYELRLVQSSQALLTFFMEQKTFCPEEALKDLEQDKHKVDDYYEILVEKGKKLTTEEIDELLSIYLLHSYSVKRIYKLKDQCSQMEKYIIYLMGVNCIRKYFQTDIDICNTIHIQEDVTVQDILDACYICRDLLIGLMKYKDMKHRDGSKKDISLPNRLKELTETDIEDLTKDIDLFVSDCLKEVLFPVKHEYKRQARYIRKKNERLISRQHHHLWDWFSNIEEWIESDKDN